jgi:hypothetical protein
MRKAVGRVLALLLFGQAAQQWSGYNAAAAAAAGFQQQQQQGHHVPLLPPGAGGVLLPLPFKQRFKFPFKVVWLQVQAGASSSSSTGAPVSLQAGLGAETAAAGAGPGAAVEGQGQNSHQQQQSKQQKAFMRQLVEQQQILRAAAAAAASSDGSSGSGSPCAADVAAAAQSILADALPLELSHIGHRTLATTAANLALVHPAAVAARSLAAVAAAASHAECGQALSALQQQLGGTRWGLAAVLQNPGPGWLPALSRLLGTAPVTREDQQLWLQVLQLAERLLTACAGAMEGATDASASNAGAHCTVATYTQLQLLLQRSVTAWLQQPAAAAAAPRPPLALAASSSSWDVLRGQPSSASAASAVADALGLGGSSGAAAAVAGAAAGSSSDSVLAVTVSRQALQTLLVLVKSVKRDCAPVLYHFSQQHQHQHQHQQQQQQQEMRAPSGDGNSSSSSSRSCMQACYSLSALKPCDLIWLLCDRVIGVTEGVDYACRVLGSAVVAEVVGALKDIACSQLPTTPSAVKSAPTAAGAAAAGATAGKGSAQAESAAAAAAGGEGRGDQSQHSGVAATVLHLLEVWICRVLMPMAGRQLPGFSGKALVQAALQGLGAVVEGPLVCEAQWSQAWAEVGGTFWLSR